MTEEEAKTKFCFRSPTFGGSQQLADGPGPHCIASACMAWRWHETTDFTARADAAFRKDGSRLKPEDGFCGLAGAPQ